MWKETEATFRSGAPAHFLACDAWKFALLGDLERARRLEMMAFDRRVCGRMASAILKWKAGDRDEARKVLARFLRLWDRADPELPLLARARALRKRLGVTAAP